MFSYLFRFVVGLLDGKTESIRESIGHQVADTKTSGSLWKALGIDSKTFVFSKSMWQALNRGGKLEKQFRSCVPGLYSRLMKRQKRIELKEKARDDIVHAKEMKILGMFQFEGCPFFLPGFCWLKEHQKCWTKLKACQKSHSPPPSQQSQTTISRRKLNVIMINDNTHLWNSIQEHPKDNPEFTKNTRNVDLRLRMEDLSLALGPGSTAWGRRPKRQLATVAIEEKESDSDVSEPDLGAGAWRLRDWVGYGETWVETSPNRSKKRPIRWPLSVFF